jgi:ribonuclease E
MATIKRLSKLMFDPRFSAQPPEWQEIVNVKYLAARQAMAPAPVLPKGVVIQAKPGDAAALAADEQAAASGQAPKPQQPQAPKIGNTGAAPITSPAPL